MHPLPEGAPATLSEAFAKVSATKTPTLLDLKLMVLAEAAGKALYAAMAEGVEHPEVKAMMLTNAREEMAHAHRVSRAISLLTGETYPPPEPQDHPYLTEPLPSRPVTAASLMALAQGEFAGDTLYQGWAATCDNPEVAQLFLQNGREETRHGERMQQAAKLLA